MGFDNENMRFTPENHEALPAQVTPLVFELEPGDIRYVDEDWVQVDCTPERKTWIYRFAEAYNDLDVLETGADQDIQFVRIVCTHDGIIVDQSHTDQKLWGSVDERLKRSEGQDVDASPDDFMPVIHRIFNQDELELAEAALAEQYNIVLEGSELQPLLEAIDEFEDAPDDEEEFEEEVGSIDDEDDEELA